MPPFRLYNSLNLFFKCRMKSDELFSPCKLILNLTGSARGPVGGVRTGEGVGGAGSRRGGREACALDGTPPRRHDARLFTEINNLDRTGIGLALRGPVPAGAAQREPYTRVHYFLIKTCTGPGCCCCRAAGLAAGLPAV